MGEKQIKQIKIREDNTKDVIGRQLKAEGMEVLGRHKTWFIYCHG